MARKTMMRACALAAVLSFGLVGMPASADPGTTSHIDTLNTTIGPSTISVTGSATFVDIPVVVGEDAAADATIPGIGADITKATISRPVNGTRVNFTVDIADQPAQLNGTPEALAYVWEMNLIQDEEPVAVSLWAARTAQARRIGTTPVFFIDTCVPGDTGDLCTGASVNGRLGDGVVEWQLTPAQLKGALAGQVLQPGAQPPAVIPTTAGQFWFPNLPIDAGFMDLDYTIPGKSIRLGIAPAGTPADQVALNRTATVTSSNTYSASLPKPPSAGSYVLVAEACYGPNSCSLTSTPITV